MKPPFSNIVLRFAILYLFLSLTSLTIAYTQDTLKEPSKMNNDNRHQIIGFSTTLLNNKKPEGLLGNFMTDAVKNEAELYLRKRIDLVFISAKAIKGALNKGDISMQTIEELLPFDDSLSFLYVTGDTLKMLLDNIAKNGGAPVSGVQMKIKNMHSTNVVLDGDSILPSKKYTIIVIERNAQGWENFPFLKNIHRQNLPYTLTSIIIKYIKKITIEGKPINSYFGHRIGYD